MNNPRIIQVRRDLTKSLFQLPAQSRFSYEVSPNHTGLYSSRSWKLYEDGDYKTIWWFNEAILKISSKGLWSSKRELLSLLSSMTLKSQEGTLPQLFFQAQSLQGIHKKRNISLDTDYVSTVRNKVFYNSQWHPKHFTICEIGLSR